MQLQKQYSQDDTAKTLVCKYLQITELVLQKAVRREIYDFEDVIIAHNFSGLRGDMWFF